MERIQVEGFSVRNRRYLLEESAPRGIDRGEISIVARAKISWTLDGIRFGIRSSNANRSISSLKELHEILSGRSIMAGCLKAGARRAERLRGIKKAGARSGSMPFVSSSPLLHMAILVTRPTALPRVSKPGNSGSALDYGSTRDPWIASLWPTKGSWPYTANYEVFHGVLRTLNSLIAKFFHFVEDTSAEFAPRLCNRSIIETKDEWFRFHSRR